MLSGASLGTCDVPSVRGAASCFSRGTDWPGVPGLVALSRTIVGGAALGRAVRWVMYGALVAGLKNWHICVVNVPSPLAFGQSTSWRPTGQGLLLATVGSQDGHGVHPILRLCAQWTETQANATAGRLVSEKYSEHLVCAHCGGQFLH